MLEFYELFEDGVETINKKAQTDISLQKVLREYQGKNVHLKIIKDALYTFKISSAGVSLTTSETVNPEDMFIQIDRETAEKLLNREINPLQITSMVLFGKIKIQNIGPKEIDLVKKIVNP